MAIYIKIDKVSEDEFFASYEFDSGVEWCDVVKKTPVNRY